MSLIIAVIGALSSIIISILGAVLSYRYNKLLQLKELKKSYYIDYIVSLHNFMTENNNREFIKKYTYNRDKLLIVGSEEVVRNILQYENECAGKKSILHDKYLTDIMKSIRKDLDIKDKSYPKIDFKK
jgi:ABC-type bacteriocin/lantibiotic exporter with double-glycine peptidase domain